MRISFVRSSIHSVRNPLALLALPDSSTRGGVAREAVVDVDSDAWVGALVRSGQSNLGRRAAATAGDGDLSALLTHGVSISNYV